MGYGIVLGNFEKVHGEVAVGRRVEIYAQDTNQQESRTTHEHKSQLHGRIGLVATTPHADEQVHGDKGYLVIHKHRKEVYRDEEAEHTDRKKYQPQEKLFGQRVDFPRSEDTSKDYDSREQQHGHRHTVDTHRIMNAQRGVPHGIGHEKHFGRIAGSTFAQEHKQHDKGEDKLQRRPYHGNSPYLFHIPRKGQSGHHQQRNKYE